MAYRSYFILIMSWIIWKLLRRFLWFIQFSSFQFSRSVVFDSLWPHELQHTRPPCPSPTPGVHPTHVHWVGDAIQPFHLLLYLSLPAFSFPTPGSFLMSQFFTSGGQNIGVSMSASVLPKSIQDWFLLGWTGWISL